MVDDKYMLSRSFEANNRINLQHYLWKDGLGHLLHPSIPQDSAQLRVADIGSGTGIWLIELSRQLGPSAHLDGFDVSFMQAPPADQLPENVFLHIHDCLLPFPKDFKGVYDVVHLQNFNSIVRDNNPEPVIQSLLKILKPGGYLTWGEYDFQTWKNVEKTPTEHYNDDLGKLLVHNATFGHTQEPNFALHDWTAQLPQTFRSCGLDRITVERVPFAREISTFLLDTFIVASYEISVNVLDPLAKELGDTARQYIKAIGDNRRNIEITLDRLTVVGRKPYSAL